MIQSFKIAVISLLWAARTDAASCPKLDSLSGIKSAHIIRIENTSLFNISCRDDNNDDYELTSNDHPLPFFVTECDPNTGKWNPDLIELNVKCARIQCRLAEITSNCKFDKSEYHVGGEVRFEPHEGQEFSNSQETILFGTCRLDSQRRPYIDTQSREIPQCRPKPTGSFPCPTLRLLSHDLSFAYITPLGNGKKGRFNISCRNDHNDDYELTWKNNPIPFVVTKCNQKTGKLKPDVSKLKCERIRCRSADITSNCNFDKSRDYNVGEKVPFRPHKGQEFSKSKETVIFGMCRLDSERKPYIVTPSSEIPQCQPKSAPTRPPQSCDSEPTCRIQRIKNGYLLDERGEKISEFPVSVPVRSKLFVRCDDDFELTAKSSFKCRSNGARPPKCRRKKRTIGTNESEA
ncbi:uncharacterized protein [Oscarella lobularis]|uniref:uncharacterized protein n=1 Tax=Oscarella lobularis TaxID=121494 RepID=UPI0033144407